ncbi:hypothetical protein KM043_016543 [Ampulex compressa]|nr:hypothetical protein KM043_016543 [Ampulex compressa]
MGEPEEDVRPPVIMPGKIRNGQLVLLSALPERHDSRRKMSQAQNDRRKDRSPQSSRIVERFNGYVISEYHDGKVIGNTEKTINLSSTSLVCLPFVIIPNKSALNSNEDTKKDVIPSIPGFFQILLSSK